MFFCMWTLNFLNTIYWSSYSFLTVCSWLSLRSIGHNCVDLFLRILFSTFACLFLWCYCNSLLELCWYVWKSGSGVPSASLFLLKNPVANQGLLWVHMTLRIVSYVSVKKWNLDFIDLILKLQFPFRGMDSLTILILPIQNHGLSFRLFFFHQCFILLAVQIFHHLG